MLTREDDIDVHALHRQGWTISAIARHLGRDRKTIKAYLAGRQAGVRAPRSLPDLFEVFAPYCAQRLADDPHLWASTLFDELRDLGYVGSYPTMTRQIRARGLRPACENCRPTTASRPRSTPTDQPLLAANRVPVVCGIPPMRQSPADSEQRTQPQRSRPKCDRVVAAGRDRGPVGVDAHLHRRRLVGPGAVAQLAMPVAAPGPQGAVCLLYTSPSPRDGL